jgi:hypothetical protein
VEAARLAESDPDAAIAAALEAARCTRCAWPGDYEPVKGLRATSGLAFSTFVRGMRDQTSVWARRSGAREALRRELEAFRFGTDLALCGDGWVDGPPIASAALDGIAELVATTALPSADLASLERDLTAADGLVVPAAYRIREWRLLCVRDLVEQIHGAAPDEAFEPDDASWLRRRLPLSSRLALGAPIHDAARRRAEEIAGSSDDERTAEAFARAVADLERLPANLVGYDASHIGFVEMVETERDLRTHLVRLRSLIASRK